MSDEPVVPWLAEFQRGFSAMLRTPLARGSGTLRAAAEGFDPALCARVRPGRTLAPAERLAVYNRQYWFRLFGLLQGDYPLVCALAGAWSFNELAARFLLEHPPRGADIARAADGLDAFLADRLPARAARADAAAAAPRAALLEAARIDAGFRAVLAAAEQPAFRPTAADAAGLAGARLVPVDALAIVDEHWALLALRARLRGAPPERAVALPARHPDGPRSFAIHRGEHGPAVVPLAPLQARLLRLLLRHPLGEALGRLEAGSRPAEAGALVAAAREWLADSTRRGFWSGVR